MINDFFYFCFMQSVYSLSALIMIHENDLFLIHFQQAVTRHHSDKSALTIQDRIISITHLSHDTANFFRVIIGSEISQIILDHKIANRDTLIQKPCSDKCVIRSS